MAARLLLALSLFKVDYDLYDAIQFIPREDESTI